MINIVYNTDNKELRILILKREIDLLDILLGERKYFSYINGEYVLVSCKAVKDYMDYINTIQVNAIDKYNELVETDKRIEIEEYEEHWYDTYAGRITSILILIFFIFRILLILVGIGSNF